MPPRCSSGSSRCSATTCGVTSGVARRRMTFPLLSSIVALPLAAAVLLLFIPNRDGTRDGFVRQVALVAPRVVFGLTLLLWARFDASSRDLQMLARAPCHPAFGTAYCVGADGSG